MATVTTSEGFGEGAGASGALKPHDGEGHKVGFKAYVEAHKGAWPDDVTRATLRRETAARELLGLSTLAYAERAERCAQALLVRCPGVSASIAFSYVSHKALAEGRAKAARRAELLRAVRKVTEAVEGALFRAECAAKVAVAPVEAPKPAPFAPVPVVQVIAPRPANDVTAPPPAAVPAAAPAAMPSAGAVWARLRAAGLTRFRFVGAEARNVLVRRIDPDHGFTVVATSPADFAAVRGALEGLSLPMAERDVAGGARHFEVFPPGGPLAPEPLTPAARWPGRDQYIAYACGG